MTSLKILCVSCNHPLLESLSFAKADLRFCAQCLSVTRVVFPGAAAARTTEAAEPITRLEMTGAAVLRLSAALERDPPQQAVLAADADQHWLLQLSPVKHAALAPYYDAEAVRLARDAELQLRLPIDRRRLL